MRTPAWLTRGWARVKARAGPRWAQAKAWAAAHPYKAATLLYVLLAGLFVHDWDGYVFATAARQMLEGRTPYEVAADDPWYGYLNPADQHVQWYAYPPLPLLLMAVTYAPAVFLALPPFLDRILLKVPVLVGTLLLARVAGGWTGRLGGDAALRSRVEKRFLANPFLILVGPVWGMTDTSLMALYLGGLLLYGKGRPALAGVLVALSILVKPFPILLLLAVLPYLLARDGGKPFWRFAGAGAATGLAVVLPFLLDDARGFWRQAVGAHLARDPQGLTIWSLWPLDLLPAGAISALSLALMAASVLAIAVLATGVRGRGTTLVLTVAAAVAILVWNRVVNEQYLVLVVAPLLILEATHRLDRPALLLTRWTSGLFAAAIVVVGFHFLTFVPPDIANRLFLGRPVDLVAHDLRTLWPGFWWFVARFLGLAVPLTILALGIMALRLLRSTWRREHVGDARAALHMGPTLLACGLLLTVGIAPVVQPAGAAVVPPFEPAYPDVQVAAFYYLWWQNPAHDPAVEYGNWPPVSQVPTMGTDGAAYYTQTRGVAREHVRMMVENGIDTAIVSYHRGELERYRVFQQEAHLQGLRVVPLIELNQVYDQAIHRPIDETGAKVPYAAYRLDPGTRRAIEAFVLDLAGQLDEPSTLRIDGKPVVMFYDSYVSGVSFNEEDKQALAATLFATVPTPVLREAFNDTAIDEPSDLLRYHPTIYSGFYDPGAAALWRRAHLAQHVAFWTDLRADLERVTGPLYLISGDAWNERAGFEAGTIKSVVGLQVFDGAFVYSPSFTWGNQPTAPFNDTFALWEDRNLWLAAFTSGQGDISSTGIAPAYDDTVNRPKRGFVIPPFPPGDGSLYDRGWDSAARQRITLPAVATFNEFFEGSSIEPSREYGDRFLVQTGLERAQYRRLPAPALDVAVLVHEGSSRTSLDWSETDLSHFWGLDLLASAARAVPGGAFAAFDALQPMPNATAPPDLLLIEGGRAQFGLSPEVRGRLAAWANATPTLVLGPDVASAVHDVLGVDCRAGLDVAPDPVTLLPGDVLRADGPRALRLERGGQAYLVGQACMEGLRAGTSIKPWVATDPLADAWGGSHDATNAECMAVALRALLPGFAQDGATECRVPA